MPRRILFWMLVPLLVLFTGCDLADFGDSSRFQEEFHETHPLKAGGRLYLENFNGSVDISGWDQDTVDISGTKYASTEEMLHSITIDVIASGDSIRVRTVRPSTRWGNMGARYTIRVPRRTSLEKIATSNGSIDASFIDAPVRLTTSNGRVRVDNVQGALEVRTSNGSIRATVNSMEDGRPVTLHTSNGSVELSVEKLGRSDVTVTTSNGSVTVRLPSRIAADVVASNSNGSITNDFEDSFQGRSEKHHLEGRIGGGGPTLELRTSNGSIRLLRM
jgi:hypothetical protein